MKFTIINQFYAPDISPTAHLAASLAEHRAEVGDEVTVVSGRGSYVQTAPGATAGLSSSAGSKSASRENPRVIRLWTPRFGKSNVIKRCLDYGCFYLLACRRMLTLPRQDVIVAMTTPPWIAWTAAVHKMLHPGTRLVLWNMDCYPEVVERTGIVKEGKLPSRIMRAVSRALFRRLDHLVCLDRAMRELLQLHYDPQKRIAASIVPNWEKADFYAPELCQASKGEQTDPQLRDKMVILYTGNMGCGHCFDTVIDAAWRLRNDPVVFLFVGGGSQAKPLAEAARQQGISNVIIRDYVDREEIRRIMATAHCALITLRDDMLGVMSPSKLHANLAMSLPVIYIGPRGSNVDEAVTRFNCGASLRHGEAFTLAGVIRTLQAKPYRLAELRAAARRAFDASYCDRRTLPLLDAVLDRLVAMEAALPVSLSLEPRPLKKAA